MHQVFDNDRIVAVAPVHRLRTHPCIGERGRVGEQFARIGAARRGEHCCGGSLLLDAAVLHHDQPAGAVGRDTEIVGDQQHRGAELPPQRVDQIEDALLHRHVERAGRFVGDDQRRLHLNRNRDQYALLHAAGKLVRILFCAQLRLGQADAPEQFDHARLDRLAVAPAMDLQDLAELGADREHGIERTGRILRDQADLRAADAVQPALRPARNVGAVEQDLAAFDAPVIGEQADDRLRRGGLAGAGFAHQRHHLARLDRERHLMHDPRRLP